MTFLDKYQPQLLAILRIVAGLLFLEHGCVKLLHFPTAMAIPPGNIGMVIMAAGIIELVGGALITIGLFSRVAAFIASGEMAFAYFLGHVSRGGFWPAINGGGEAILFCFIFLYLASAGPGAWAINRR
ncbi:MAG TPA: DoxX family protein [Rhizomicrobium sp.]